MKILLVLLALTSVAFADTLDVPASKDPVPLLVVLHGDRERASTAAVRWRAAANKRGWAVLSLQCPTTAGCKDSWWQWDGDPAYVWTQIEKVATTVKLDRTRIAIAGWSGGATYIGMRAAEWGSISGVVIHGGGMAPASETCPARLPAYFLVGDKNPLHRLAVDLRALFDGCKQPVTWDLVTGGDHDREDRALDLKKAIAILDWLTSHPLSSVPATPARRAPAPPRSP